MEKRRVLDKNGTKKCTVKEQTAWKAEKTTGAYRWRRRVKNDVKNLIYE